MEKSLSTISLSQAFAGVSAARGADYLLSPHLKPQFLLDATSEEGPSLWIVNRSDVYDASLEALSSHPIEGISSRAKEKLSVRRGTLQLLPEPPPLEGPIEAVPDYMIEDLLGHPLAPFEVMLFFTHHLLEDYRASACLSLSRRLLEFPPNWLGHENVKNQIQSRIHKILIDDPSPFVRSYAARVPLLDQHQILESLKKETHPFVQGRLVQNPAFDFKDFGIEFAHRSLSSSMCDSFVAGVLAADGRLPLSLRKEVHPNLSNLAAIQTEPERGIGYHCNSWHLSAGASGG